jgi:hypothetical protein
MGLGMPLGPGSTQPLSLMFRRQSRSFFPQEFEPKPVARRHLGPAQLGERLIGIFVPPRSRLPHYL